MTNITEKDIMLAAIDVWKTTAQNVVNVPHLANMGIKDIAAFLRREFAPDLIPAAQKEPVPAVAVSESVTPDYIVCLEDGVKVKLLRRHLRKLGVTPEEYKAKWNLPHDYPFVAPNYAQRRSTLALQTGLGRRKD